VPRCAQHGFTETTEDVETASPIRHLPISLRLVKAVPVDVVWIEIVPSLFETG